jgi:hypothetical protein
MPAADQDSNYALRLYVWNARICESFYLPQQLLEVALRNALHPVIVSRYGASWHTSIGFISAITHKAKGELNDVVVRERGKRGAGFTIDHVIAGLSFGFWTNLLTKSFENNFWAQGMLQTFPHAPKTMKRGDISAKAEGIRKWRNMIAHHYAIFDKMPTKEYQDIIEFISWLTPDTAWLAKELSRVSTIVNSKPSRLSQS